MKVQYRSFVASPQSPAAEFLSARSMLSANGNPHLLGYTPVARMNPYQGLIYRQFPAHGIAVAPILDPTKFRDIAHFRRISKSSSVHLHWNSWMIQNAPDLDRARTLGKGMVGRFQRLRDQGVNVIWTVHNVYPHDARFVELELELQQDIANAANVVHVMSQGAVKAMEEFTELDHSKILVSPHPSYAGSYVDSVGREEARAMLGIAADEVVFLMFGAIKAYKGLQLLADAVEIFAKETDIRFRVVVAGGADNSSAAQEFVRYARTHPSFLVESNNVPNERAQYFLRAADLGLVNYDRSLNSGAALLYGTFDLPVIAADTPTFREELDPTSTEFVSDRTPEAFARAMGNSLELVGNSRITESVQTHIGALHPSIVSNQLATDLLKRII